MKSTALLAVLFASSCMAQNSNLSDLDRYIHNQSESNTRYFNNADNYPKSGGSYSQVWQNQIMAAHPVSRPRRDIGERYVPTERENASATSTPASSYQWWKEMSSKGDAAATDQLASCNYQGYGTAVNKAEAYRLWNSIQGSSEFARVMSAAMLYAGDGITANEAEGMRRMRAAAAVGDKSAETWLAEVSPSAASIEKQAAQGNYIPMLNYGVWMREGENGLTKDRTRGLTYIEKAAVGGNARALTFAGRAYEYGDGVPEDLTKAETYLLKAYAAKERVTYDLSALYFEHVQPLDLVKARRYAAELLQHQPDATDYVLAGLIEYTAGDMVAARRFWSDPGAAKAPQALFALAGMERKGLGGPEDEAAGTRHIVAAAEAKDPQGLFEMGVMYRDGSFGFEKDPVKSTQMFQESATLGLASAQNSVAIAYYQGRGVTKDLEKAAMWAQKGADQRFAKSELMLAYLYADGAGVPKDAQKAVQLMRLAAEHGDPTAQGEIDKGYGGK